MTINSTKLFLNTENMLHNVSYLKQWKKKEILTVVKANAYGHGMEEIVGILYKNGQREFAVARYVEAKRILKMGLEDVRVLIFESIGDFSLIDSSNIDISVNTFEELKAAIEFGIPANRIQIKIDFGFGRNGIMLNEIEKLQKFIERKKLKFRGLYSHLFAVSYEDGKKYIDIFSRVIEKLGKNNFEIVHLQNSAATLSYDCEMVTHLRVGMGIYGLQDEGFFDKNLKQVFSLKSYVASVRDLENSDYVAYTLKSNLCVPNCKYVAKIKIGYADGFLKINEGSTCLIGNREFKILQVTMDNTFISVDTSVKENDEVELYYNVPVSTNHTKMTIYELLTILSPRIKREVI